MNAVVSRVSKSTGEVTEFNPQETRDQIAKADALADYAQKVRDWPLAERAIEEKIEQQQEFVRWWKETVSDNQGSRTDLISDRKFSSKDAFELTHISTLQVHKWTKRLKDVEKYRAGLFTVLWKKAMGELPEQSTLILSSASNEHYTPARYVEAARDVMGTIDLDPASCDAAQKAVKAAEYFTIQRQGMDKPWHGNVWLNPPYGGLAQKFIGKLMTEIGEGRVHQAVVLVNAHCTDTGWFQPLFDGAICFTNHRINFYGDDSRSGSTHGSAFSYFGPNVEDFELVFSDFGPVLQRLR